MSQALLRLVEYPELVKPLREEAIQVLSEKGWSIQSLYQLQLMDSFFKECQRHDRPLGKSFRRLRGAVDLTQGD